MSYTNINLSGSSLYCYRLPQPHRHSPIGNTSLLGLLLPLVLFPFIQISSTYYLHTCYPYKHTTTVVLHTHFVSPLPSCNLGISASGLYLIVYSPLNRCQLASYYFVYTSNTSSVEFTLFYHTTESTTNENRK